MVVNELYSESIITQANEQFLRNTPVPNVLLPTVFSPDVLRLIQNQIPKLQFVTEHEIMRHTYDVAEVNSVVGEILGRRDFVTFLSQFIKKDLHWQVLKLSWKNYKMLVDSEEMKTGQDVIIDITPHRWNDSHGGSIIYTVGEDYLEFGYLPGGCFIIDRKPGTRRFFKYVNHYADGRDRIVLIGSNCQDL